MKEKIYLIFFILLFINLVSAKPPVQSLAAVDGLDIKVPARDIIIENKNYEIEVHVYNTSNGVPLTSGIGCYLHLYNSTGKHFIEMYDNTVSHDFDYSFQLYAPNITVGDYTVLVQCNNSKQGGFYEYSLEVTTSGLEYTKTISFYIIILCVSFLLIFMGFYIKDAWVTILGTFGLYFIGLYILLNGITGIKNNVITYPIGIIILAIASYISISSAKEMID